MRPKKRVLLYCCDEVRASHVGLVLRTRGFDVTPVDCAEHLAHELDWNPPFAGVLVLDSGEPDHAEQAVDMVQRHAARAPVLLQLSRQRLAVTHAERGIAHGARMEELVAAVQVLCAQKRGRKGPQSGRPLPIGARRAVDVARKAVVA